MGFIKAGSGILDMEATMDSSAMFQLAMYTTRATYHSSSSSVVCITLPLSRRTSPTPKVTAVAELTNESHLGISLATLFILVRSAFRVAELVNGFSSALANDQVSLMILESGMISLATILLTVFHPGHVFKGNWDNSGWGKNQKRARRERKSVYGDEEGIEMA